MLSTRAIGVSVWFALGTATVALGPGAVAGAPATSVTIAPHETFIGSVNGEQVSASVDVVCRGPLRRGQMGHPAAGQTVGVSTPAPPIAWTGDTGSRGRSITARFVTATTAATPTVTFSRYGTRRLPTTGLLPCEGSGAVVFSPLPSSHTGRSGRVSVRYLPTCTNPCPLARRR